MNRGPISVAVTLSCNHSTQSRVLPQHTVLCPQNLQSEQLRNFYPSTDGNATTNETGRLRSVPYRAEKRTHNFCWKSEVNSPLVRPSRKEVENIKNFKFIGTCIIVIVE